MKIVRIRVHFLKFYLAILTAFTAVSAQHTSLFSGIDLEGWHPQAECEWSVEEGAIKGFNPQGTWCHLVTDDSSYTDYYISLLYKIVKGNTGLYIRTRNEDGGCCGIEGIQVDIGPSQDGSLMPVVNGEWFWTHRSTKAVDENVVDYTDWNELAVEVSGMSVKTWVNGVLIIDAPEVPERFESGGLALQLHSGGVGDENLFKEIELYQPTKITGCMDSGFEEFSEDANYPDSSQCLTPIAIGIKLLTNSGPEEMEDAARWLFDVRGKRQYPQPGRFINIPVPSSQ